MCSFTLHSRRLYTTYNLNIKEVSGKFPKTSTSVERLFLEVHKFSYVPNDKDSESNNVIGVTPTSVCLLQTPSAFGSRT